MIVGGVAVFLLLAGLGAYAFRKPQPRRKKREETKEKDEYGARLGNGRQIRL
jgi:hypothetical protein